MTSRRKFLKVGALFLPAAAMGQVANRRLYSEPPFGTLNYSEDYMRFWNWGGSGWNGPAQLPGTSVQVPVTRLTSGGSVDALTGQVWQYSRQPIYLSNWSQIRVACLMTIDQTAASITSMNILLGMINNFNTVFNATNTNFIGFMMGGGAAWSQVPHAGTPYYSSGASDRYQAKVVNGSGTYNSIGSSPNIFATNSTHRTLLMCDILKGTPSFTVQGWSIATDAGMSQDFDRNDMNTLLGVAGGGNATIKGSTFNWGTASVAFTETNALDTVAVYSGPAAGTNTSLYAVGVRKIS